MVSACSSSSELAYLNGRRSVQQVLLREHDLREVGVVDVVLLQKAEDRVAGRPLVEGLRLLEDDIWLIAERSLKEEEVEALRALIPRIRERYRDQVFVSSIA